MSLPDIIDDELIQVARRLGYSGVDRVLYAALSSIGHPAHDIQSEVWKLKDIWLREGYRSLSQSVRDWVEKNLKG